MKTGKRYVLLITPCRGTKMVECDDGEGIKLETLQELVGGYIETVPSALAAMWSGDSCIDSIILLVDEEGKLKPDRRANDNATDVSSIYYDVLYGNAVMVATKGEELVGMSEQACRYIMKEWLLPEAENAAY